MNPNNQAHPLRFPQFVKIFQWNRWEASQRFSVARPGSSAGLNVRHQQDSAKASPFWERPTFLRTSLVAMLLESVLLFPSNALAQRTLQGRVVNGTTNRPVAQQKIELLTLGEGMNKNADAVSAADGSFRFTITESASSPHWLLRAIYQGVNYNVSVTPDQDLSKPVAVTIYETTQSQAGLEVSLPLMLAQASGNLLYVQQQYLLDNTSTPKKTLARADGTFSFDAPARELLSELSVSVVGLAGIPLPQEPASRPEGGYRISYPMKPGVNEIRVSYKVNYPSNQREFNHRLFYATGPTKVLILPASLQVSGTGIQPAGSDSRTQASVYQVTPTAKAPTLQFKVAGDAPVVSEEGERASGDGPQAKVVRLSNRVIENKNIILTGFGIVFAAAILFALSQKAAWRQAAAAKVNAAETRKRRG